MIATQTRTHGRWQALAELTLDDGTTVEASVEGGWWAAWAPGDASLPDTATVTTAVMGTSTAVSVRVG